MSLVELSFESDVAASADEDWRHITFLPCISREMHPYLRITAPEGVESIANLEVALGQPLFRSRLFLFGILPVGHSLLTLIELEEGVGFIEESPMSWMKLWRHERKITATGTGCVVSDRLTFQPIWAAGVAAWFIRILFNRRHAVLRSLLGKPEAEERKA